MVLNHHIMSSTDRSSFQHLANYLSAGSHLSANEILCPMFRDIHVAHDTSVIYNLQTLPSFTIQRAIIDLAPKTCVVYNCIVYILHQKFSWSTIRSHIGTLSTFGSQIIYYNTLI